jgi:hypothetical protein
MPVLRILIAERCVDQATLLQALRTKAEKLLTYNQHVVNFVNDFYAIRSL